MDRWGLADASEAAQLIVSELSTNAVLHGRSGFHVSIGIVGGADAAIRVAVHDESATQPAPRAYSSSSATGRGLRLVEAYSTRWGTVSLAERKAVWAEVAETDRPCG